MATDLGRVVGSMIYTGEGEPTIPLEQAPVLLDYDLYIDETTQILYQYINEVWIEKFCLKGDTGEPGKDGSDGKDGTNGTNGYNGQNGLDALMYDGTVVWTGSAEPVDGLSYFTFDETLFNHTPTEGEYFTAIFTWTHDDITDVYIGTFVWKGDGQALLTGHTKISGENGVSAIWYKGIITAPTYGRPLDGTIFAGFVESEFNVDEIHTGDEFQAVFICYSSITVDDGDIPADNPYDKIYAYLGFFTYISTGTATMDGCVVLTGDDGTAGLDAVWYTEIRNFGSNTPTVGELWSGFDPDLFNKTPTIDADFFTYFTVTQIDIDGSPEEVATTYLGTLTLVAYSDGTYVGRFKSYSRITGPAGTVGTVLTYQGLIEWNGSYPDDIPAAGKTATIDDTLFNTIPTVGNTFNAPITWTFKNPSNLQINNVSDETTIFYEALLVYTNNNTAEIIWVQATSADGLVADLLPAIDEVGNQVGTTLVVGNYKGEQTYELKNGISLIAETEQLTDGTRVTIKQTYETPDVTAERVFDLTNGITPTISMGTVTSVAAGGTATATLTKGDTDNDYLLNLGIVTGATGATGSSGSTPSLQTVYYATSSSATTTPSSFSTTRPTLNSGEYLWTRMRFLQGSSYSSYFYIVSGGPGYDGADGKDGANGADGKDGTNGTDGKDGANGKDSSIIATQQSDGVLITATSGDGTVTTATVYNGADGKDGANGTNGTDGKDGADGTYVSSISFSVSGNTLTLNQNMSDGSTKSASCTIPTEVGTYQLDAMDNNNIAIDTSGSLTISPATQTIKIINGTGSSKNDSIIQNGTFSYANQFGGITTGTIGSSMSITVEQKALVTFTFDSLYFAERSSGTTTTSAAGVLTDGTNIIDNGLEVNLTNAATQYIVICRNSQLYDDVQKELDNGIRITGNATYSKFYAPHHFYSMSSTGFAGWYNYNGKNPAGLMIVDSSFYMFGGNGNNEYSNTIEGYNLYLHGLIPSANNSPYIFYKNASFNSSSETFEVYNATASGKIQTFKVTITSHCPYLAIGENSSNTLFTQAMNGNGSGTSASMTFTNLQGESTLIFPIYYYLAKVDNDVDTYFVTIQLEEIES